MENSPFETSRQLQLDNAANGVHIAMHCQFSKIE
jgi:hypothetical protein